MGRVEYKKLRPENRTIDHDKKLAERKTLTEKEFKPIQSSLNQPANQLQRSTNKICTGIFPLSPQI